MTYDEAYTNCLEDLLKSTPPLIVTVDLLDKQPLAIKKRIALLHSAMIAAHRQAIGKLMEGIQ